METFHEGNSMCEDTKMLMGLVRSMNMGKLHACAWDSYKEIVAEVETGSMI